MAEIIPSSVSNPSGSATKVSREIFGLKFFRIVSRQLAIPCLHSQEGDRLKVRQDLLTFAQFGSPGTFLFSQPLETVLAHFEQAETPQCVTAYLEGVLPLLLLTLQTLLMSSMEFVKGILALAFGF